MSRIVADTPRIAGKADVSPICTVEETLRLLQKYQVRQRELENQIHELRNSTVELEASRDKFALLYDVAPVGYFSFDRGGRIRSVNLTGASLLGIERSPLIDRSFECL